MAISVWARVFHGPHRSAVALDEEHLQTAEECIEVELALGHAARWWPR